MGCTQQSQTEGHTAVNTQAGTSPQQEYFNPMIWSIRMPAKAAVPAGVSSTGVVAINAVLLPESDKVLMWARVHMDGSKNNYEPGVIGADGVPEVSAVYNTNKGKVLC